MRRWTTIVAFLAIFSILAGCTGGGGATTAPSAPASEPAPGASSSAAAEPSGSAAAGDSAACNPPRQEGVTLSFTSFGGVYQEAQRKAWLEPYTELTGVEFTEDENSSNATIQAQVESGQVTWDVVDVGNDFGLDVHSDLLEPLDYSLIPRDELNADLGITDYRIPDITYGVVLALQHRGDSGRGPRGLGRLLRHDEDPGQARRMGLLRERDVRVRPHGRWRRAGRPLPARPAAGDGQAEHHQGRHRVLGVGRRITGAHRLR